VARPRGVVSTSFTARETALWWSLSLGSRVLCSPAVSVAGAGPLCAGRVVDPAMRDGLAFYIRGTRDDIARLCFGLRIWMTARQPRHTKPRQAGHKRASLGVAGPKRQRLGT